MYNAIVFVIPPICLVLAALTDFLEMTIPNRISVVILGAFILVAPFSDLNSVQLGWHAVAGAAVFFACFALFAINVMGGGDAKLLTAAAVWFGFNQSLFEFLALTGLIGGGLTLAVILMRANWDILAAIGIKLPNTFMVANKIPYGIAIGAAGLLTYPSSPLVMSAIHNFA
ncbi:A24 family peptidase [Rhizobium rhizophilum]|uniref:Peptidase n=1 Tax=Rhizobium rhizophilum TaxID=1850373 RepID=A0ABY2R159_9HYPH|nr:prepilin peptidase [Rhizobium rhizophilum]THV17433.1 peptidase [Rhizobium rhizophilum]